MMRLSKPEKWKWNYTALSFLIPVVGMLIVMIFSRYRPFGKYSMLYSDMYHQYYPFFVEFRRTLREGGSLLYNWNIGMGVDYLGLISYYLSSPLNLLSVLVPESQLLNYFSLLVPLKLGFAGLFYGIFLKRTFHRDDFSVPMFSAFYAACAWALGFQWNVMWLDTFAIFPLVVLGTVSLIRDKKFLLYTLTLFASLWCNYYIGFFTCIFVALLFFCYEFCRFPGWKRFGQDFGRIALFSLLAIGMTAILFLPTLRAMQTTQSGVNKFPNAFVLNIAKSNTIFGLLGAMKTVAGNMGGALEPNFKEGLPNLYCGIGSLLLAFLYLESDEISWRDKLCCVGLLLFFNISFIIRQLDYIWHGFHFTNMIPYRFSFLYSFVVLYMAYQAWLHRREYDTLQIAAAGCLTAAMLCCSNSLLSTQELKLPWGTLKVYTYLLYNGIFLLLFLMVLLYGALRTRPKENTEEERKRLRSLRRFRRKQVTTLFLGIMILEFAANMLSFGLYFPGTAVSNYPKGTEHAASMIRYMKEREANTLFYRAETTHSQTLNDGSLNGYSGISAFTSSANVRCTEFMKALGFGAKNTYNRYCYEESSPVADLFLSIKYRLEREGKDRSSSQYSEVHHFGKVYLLRNESYLPLGFLAEPELADVDFTSSANAFQFQNELFSAATGLSQMVWHRVQGDQLELLPDLMSVNDSNTNGYCAYSDCRSGANLVYSYTADREGFACVHLNLPKRNSFYIRVNGEEVCREDWSLPQMLAVGDVQVGDVVEIQVLCDEKESGTMSVALAITNPELFRQGYEILSASQLQLTSFRDTRVEGFIDCNRDGPLYTSVPQNGNWIVYVDGKEAPIHLTGECMIGVMLSQGQHTVDFVYRNVAFSLGWKISLLSALLFLGTVQVSYHPDWKKVLRRG